jgi:hypothetical protein
LRGGCVICTAVIRVIARYFPKFLLQLQARFPNFLPVSMGSGERGWLRAFPAAAKGTQGTAPPRILRVLEGGAEGGLWIRSVVASKRLIGGQRFLYSV